MNDSTIADILRKPFPANVVGKLPRVTCPKCSDRRADCPEHKKSKCGDCGNYISERHIHIDYVGHADVTSRLLEADPEWTWEPKAKDVDKDVMAAALASGNAELVAQVLASSPPQFDTDDRGNAVGLWILLTVGGVTRPGYGSVPSGQPDAVKVLIGDALRNAAMRFGVALDLWAKGDRADPTAENATASAGHATGRSQRAPAPRAQSPRPARALAPADAATDVEWMGHVVDDLIPAATTRNELAKLWDEVEAKIREGKCTHEHAQQVRAMITGRADELGFSKDAAA